ncbi:MAG TPA: NTP transferase domain-containing protein, partial [Chloroflexota bacterium]|nr:NTP transferase domain-containing protein [Chloroflexota bacterium]
MKDLPPNPTIGAIILAAGRGKRMSSAIPKVLQRLNGRPMLTYVIEVLSELGFGSSLPTPVVVIGYGGEEIRVLLGDNAVYAQQSELLGTGDAAATGLTQLGPEVRTVLLVHGDEPMIEAHTFREMLALHQRTRGLVLLTGDVQDTHGLGRVIRDSDGKIVGLVQDNELTEAQRAVREINFGAYVFDRAFLERTLPTLEKHLAGEYYLTDLISTASEVGVPVENVRAPFPDDQMGVNDPTQLERAA